MTTTAVATMTRNDFISAIFAALKAGECDRALSLANEALDAGHTDVYERALLAQERVRLGGPAEYDAGQLWNRRRAKAAAAAKKRLAVLREGHYLVSLEAADVYFRIGRQRDNAAFAPGQLIVSWKVGGVDFQACAFGLDEGGYRLWAKWKGNSLLANALATLVADPKAAGLAYGRETVHCCICNRELTDETSRAEGIGPVCREKWYA